MYEENTFSLFLPSCFLFLPVVPLPGSVFSHSTLSNQHLPLAAASLLISPLKPFRAHL